jgi:hypothetical protein
MIIEEEVYFQHDVDEISDFLDHHGVKGQKWGIRKQHQVNKASRQRERKRNRKQIDAARERYRTTAGPNYQKAKAQYKIDKKIKGRAEAMRILNKTKDKNINDYVTGSRVRDGKEVAGAIAGGALGLALYTGIMYAAKHH